LPNPWRNYFSGSSTECAQNWYVSLGSLVDGSVKSFADSNGLMTEVLA